MGGCASRPSHHPPQSHPIAFKSLRFPVGAAVDVVVLVPMHRHAHAHAAGQGVQLFEAVLVVARRFVGDQDVGLLRGQLLKLVGVDAGPVLEVHAALPAVLARRHACVRFAVAKFGRLLVFGVPHRTAKHTAQPGDARAARQRDDAAVQLPLAHFGVPHVAKVVRMVGVVVAVDEPDPLPNGFQLDVQRPCRFQVAQQDHGASAALLSCIEDVLPLAVGVAAEEDGAGVHGGE